MELPALAEGVEAVRRLKLAETLADCDCVDRRGGYVARYARRAQIGTEHGNFKTVSEANTIHAEKDFSAGGGSTVSNVDLTPYFNGVSYNNGTTPPQLTLQSASGNTTVNLRDCYTKSQVYTKTEVDALLNTERARITTLESSLSTIITTVNNILAILGSMSQWANQVTTVLAGLTSGQGNSGGSGGGLSFTLPGNVNNPFGP